MTGQSSRPTTATTTTSATTARRGDAPSQSAPPLTLGKRWRLFAFKLLFSASLTLLLLEGGLRLVGVRPVSASVPRRDAAELCADRDVAEAQRRDWIPWPTPIQSATRIPEHPRGYVEIRRNRQSLREDNEIPWRAPPGTRRIVCVGDSHTDGVCWNEESYPNRLESLLNSERGSSEPHDASPRGRFDVVNAGFGPSSPYQQLWAYERVHRRFRPDLLVVSFYAGNDLADLMRTDLPVRLERRDGRLEHVGTAAAAAPSMESARNRSWLEQLKQPLRDYSSTYHALTRVAWLRRAVVRHVGMGDPYFDRIEYAALANAGPVWQGLNQAYYFHHHPDDWKEAVARQRWVLRRFQTLAEEDGIPLRLVLIPTLRMIHPETDAEALADTIRVLELDADAVAADARAYDAVRGLAEELQIKAFDLRPMFQERRRTRPDEPLYFRFDHHLNTRANEWIAAELAGEVARELNANTDLDVDTSGGADTSVGPSTSVSANSEKHPSMESSTPR